MRIDVSVRALVIGLLLLSSAISTSCAPVRPWQRARLAHWSMTTNDGESPGDAHVHAVNEGAVGGGTTVEGGCGCN